jgi:hypothetical protein
VRKWRNDARTMRAGYSSGRTMENSGLRSPSVAREGASQVRLRRNARNGSKTPAT